MHVSGPEFRAMRRRLMNMGRKPDLSVDGHLERAVHSAHEDFKIRPISEEWRGLGRRPAYKTAVANVAYCWRDGTAVDRFGVMPASFAQRSYELRAAGLMLPDSAPAWAAEGYRIWEEADAAAVATRDPTAISAWHVVCRIPPSIDEMWWEWLVRSFIQRELAGKGAPVAYAIHALRGADDDWVIHPHVHLIVAARFFRHDRRAGRRHPGWLSDWRAHLRLERAWRTRCALAKVTGRARTGHCQGLAVPWQFA